MSDHPNRPQHENDPLADRLRAFGGQTAHTASLPPVEQIHRGGDRRRRNQRIATAGATLAVATIIGGSVIASQLGDRGDNTLLPSTQTPTPTATTPEVTPTIASTTRPTVTKTPTSTPSGQSTPSLSRTGTVGTPSTGTPSSPTSEPYAGKRIDLGGKATVLVPQGWNSKQTTSFIDQGTGISVPELCLNDGATNGPAVTCDIEVQWGPVTVGHEGQDPWEPGQAGGWYHRSDASPCFLPQTATDGSDLMTASNQIPTSSYGPVGSKSAVVNRYKVDCSGGRSFTSTMWWLPTTQLRFHDIVGNSRADDILASVRFAGQ